MNYENIISGIEDDVFYIKINRPEVLNSINTATGKEIQSALDAANEVKTVRAVLLTGSGRAFCAGQDLSEALPKDAPPADISSIVKHTYNPIVSKIRALNKPVICAVNGVAAGAGANIALACDLLIASEKASFIQAFAKIGLIPDSGGTYILPRLVGYHKAFSLMAFGDKLTAEEAYKLGIVYKIFPQDSFDEEAMKFAKMVADMPTKALALTKYALNESSNNNFNTQLSLEEKLQSESAASFDYKEGVNAFLQKRNPEFKGE